MKAFRTVITAAFLIAATGGALAQIAGTGQQERGSSLANSPQNRAVDRLGDRQRLGVGAPGVRAQGQPHFGTTSSVPVGVNSVNSR